MSVIEQTIPYGSSVWQNTSQSITASTLTLIQFDTVIYDFNGLWNNTNKRFVVGEIGFFTISANIFVNATNNTSSDSYIVVRKNGVNVIPGMMLKRRFSAPSTPDLIPQPVCLSGMITDYASLPTDYYDLLIFCSGTGRTIGGANTSGCTFNIQLELG